MFNCVFQSATNGYPGAVQSIQYSPGPHVPPNHTAICDSEHVCNCNRMAHFSLVC